jgi:hypothetical protein
LYDCIGIVIVEFHFVHSVMQALVRRLPVQKTPIPPLDEMDPEETEFVRKWFLEKKEEQDGAIACEDGETEIDPSKL